MQASHPVFISHHFPPVQNARAIQMKRMMEAYPSPYTLHCYGHRDERELFGKGSIIRHNESWFARFSHRLRGKLFPKGAWCPDLQHKWNLSLAAKLKDNKPDDPVLITIGMPMSSHLCGLEIQKSWQCPWIAFFSDPWSNNPYLQPNPCSENNRIWELQVMDRADLLVFANHGTKEMSMKVHNGDISAKTRVLEPCISHEPPPPPPPSEGPVVIRHIGALYAQRSPLPFCQALKELYANTPDLANHLKVEFIGSLGLQHSNAIQQLNLPNNILKCLPPVPFEKAKQLMASSHVLLAINPAEGGSHTLMSKLTDCIWANRPLLVPTPPSPTMDWARAWGGWVIDNRQNEVCRITEALKSILDHSEQLLQGNYPLNQSFKKAHLADAFSLQFHQWIVELAS